MVDASADSVAAAVLSTYSRLNFRPPDGQFTISAGFVLQNSDELKVISLGTGSKCLPVSRLPETGDALHDSHAEVLARRGAVRWFLEETARVCSSPQSASPWISRQTDGKFALKRGSALNMYISTAPCGDASTRYLASLQDPQMAALKDSSQLPALAPNTASRGRDNYSLYGVMRTKPGRADSPPTLSMSCSDKIASWNVLGIQGALASRLLHPIYIDRLVVGEVELSMHDVVLEDCRRALYARLNSIADLPPPFRLNKPSIEFTLAPFVHSKVALPGATGGCNDSLCFIADSAKPSEVLINGIRRGVPPKHRHNPKFRPLLSKLYLYGVFEETSAKTGLDIHAERTYYESKQMNLSYTAGKLALKGPGGPFQGWVTSGRKWEEFDANGNRVLVNIE